MKYYNYHLSKLEEERCRNSFEYFCTNYVKIPIKRHMEKFQPFDHQLKLAKEIDDKQLLIAKVYRQGGWNTLVNVWSIWKCLFFPNTHIAILSTMNFMVFDITDNINKICKELPRWLPRFEIYDDYEKRFDNGSVIYIDKLLDGAFLRRLDHLFLDNISAVYDSDAEEAWKRLYPNLSTGGKCFIFSTPNGKNNWFHRMYRSAQDKISLFDVFPTDYREHYKDQSYMYHLRINIGDKFFRQDYECEFI